MQRSVLLHTGYASTNGADTPVAEPDHDAVWKPTAPADTGMAAVQEAGAGPDVVFVHGSLGDYRQWTPVAGALAAPYRLVAVSRRFHWPQAAADDRVLYTYEAHRDDLLALLRTAASSVHLVGHSYGAGVVLLAALAEPARLRSLVLIEPAFNSLLPETEPGLDDERVSRGAMLDAVRQSAAAGDHHGAARALIDWVQGRGGDFASLPPWVRSALLDNATTAGPTVSYAPPHLTRDELRGLRVPTLVVAGERTRLYYRLIAREVAAAVPGAVLRELAGAAHMTIVERPAELAALLVRFFGGPGPE